MYPNEFIDSFKKVFDGKLSGRGEFYSSLKGECISEKDYSHATDVWFMFKMNTMGDYHDLYLKKYTLLIADVFAKFINTFCNIMD